jgi:hypothetical protein
MVHLDTSAKAAVKHVYIVIALSSAGVPSVRHADELLPWRTRASPEALPAGMLSKTPLFKRFESEVGIAEPEDFELSDPEPGIRASNRTTPKGRLIGQVEMSEPVAHTCLPVG